MSWELRPVSRQRSASSLIKFAESAECALFLSGDL